MIVVSLNNELPLANAKGDRTGLRVGSVASAGRSRVGGHRRVVDSIGLFSCVS
jgi:hypothetical protein